MNHRKVSDGILNALTYLFSSVGVVILLAIVIFVFSKGFKTLSWDLITSDYYSTTYVLSSDEVNKTFVKPENASYYFSTVYGIGIVDDKNTLSEPVVKIVYIDNDSPFLNLKNTTDSEVVEVKIGYEISKMIMTSVAGQSVYAFSKDGASNMASLMDGTNKINSMTISYGGGGIRGSLITTIYMIIMTLIIALPLGILAAIYLHEYAPKNKFTNIIRTMIDMISGIPSIIFGLVGAIIFIPFVDTLFKSNGGSILSGAFTLAIILLPTIIKTTEESLIVIPDSYRNASLALGASKTQTIRKVVLPNAIPGILTSVLLSIGRIIGESAALIYAVGTAIKDDISLTGKSSTLAVHIWSLLSGENPNYEVACAISIIILLVVFIMNLLVKLISKKLNKMEA
ncbi:MAG: phosphate ABC transporter permease PstA [Anaeroplasmataceae bacterium]